MELSKSFRFHLIVFSWISAIDGTGTQLLLQIPLEFLVSVGEKRLVLRALEAPLELAHARVRVLAINGKPAFRLVTLQYAHGRLQHRVVHLLQMAQVEKSHALQLSDRFAYAY